MIRLCSPPPWWQEKPWHRHLPARLRVEMVGAIEEASRISWASTLIEAATCDVMSAVSMWRGWTFRGLKPTATVGCHAVTMARGSLDGSVNRLKLPPTSPASSPAGGEDPWSHVARWGWESRNWG